MALALVITQLIPVILLILLVNDRKFRLILMFFAWGSIAALMAAYSNGFIAGLNGINLQEFAITFAPLIEEFFKGLPLIVLFLLNSSALKEKDIIIRAISSGIGFSIVENYSYLMNASGMSVIELSLFIFTRSLSTSIMHGLSTGFIGLSIYFISNGYLKKFRFEFIFVVMAYSFSVMYHAYFNLYVQFSLFGKVIALILVLAQYLITWIFFELYYEKI